MNIYTAWVTLLRDGIPRRHILHADSIEQARGMAADYAACLYPLQSLAVAVWSAA
jgi:hypothetical protein